MIVDLEFLAACNEFGRERHVDVSFFEDEYDGWYCRLSFSDSASSYTALVAAVERVRNGKSKEEPESFAAKVRRHCSTAAARAHQSRHGRMLSQLEQEN